MYANLYRNNQISKEMKLYADSLEILEKNRYDDVNAIYYKTICNNIALCLNILGEVDAAKVYITGYK